MKKKLLFLAILILSGLQNFGQRTLVFPPQELIEKEVGTELEELAVKVQKKADDPNINLKYGYCLLITPDKKQESIKYIKTAIELFGDKKKNEEMKVRTQVLLAQAYRITGQIDDAFEEYDKLKPILTKYPDLKKLIDQDKEQCQTALDLMMNPKYVSIVNFDVINSKFQDHSPMLLYDTVLIFTSKQKSSTSDKKSDSGDYSEDVYFSSDASGAWSTPQSLAKKLESEEDLANCGVSPDKQTIYCYRNFDVWEVQKKKDKWQKMKLSKLPVNSKDGDDKHMSFSADGNTIYFSSKRPHGGRGGFDIYKIEKKGDQWSDAKLLGDEINTPYDEDGPCIAADGTLYFSSKGHNSMGGYDIFKAAPDGKDGFKTPENLGWPTNSVEHDVYYFLSRDGKRAFFTSTREGGKGKADIYMINYADFLMVHGCAMKKGGEVAGVNVIMNSVPTKKQIENPKLKQDCTYGYLIDRNSDYFISAEAKDYYFETFTFKTPGVEVTDMELQKVILQPIIPAKIFKQYETLCGTELENESILFLNTLIRFLKINPGFIADFSMTTEQRANNCVNYLRDNNIPEKQISVNVFKADAKGKCLVTIHDKVITPEPVVVAEVVKVPEKQVAIVKPEKKIVYTIQVGAFRKVNDPTHWFFKKQQVAMRDGIDDINRFTIGVYDTEKEALEKLPMYQNLFWDAFIREVEWYKDGRISSETIQ